VLIKRTFSSILLLSIVGFIIFFASDIIFGFTVTCLIFIALLEFFGLTQHNNIHVFKYFSSIAGLVFPVMFTFGLINFIELPLLFFIFILLCLFLLEFTKKDDSYVATDIGISMFGIIYIALTISFLIPIRYLENGNMYIVFLILVVKASDIGAYIIGKKFGKLHLIPRISPKKSVEGAIGGLVFSIITAVIASLFINIPMIHFIFMGFILGILAQVGDLSESLIKRYFKVKDSGKFIPGFGGLLDLLDSLLFTTPLFYLYLILMI